MEIDPLESAEGSIDTPANPGHARLNTWVAITVALLATFMGIASALLALKAGGGDSNANSNDFRNGVELIYRQFQDALQKIGVQPIPALGQVFDPRVHEAVEMVDTTEVADHHVFDELQRGYKYKDRLLRPAMVRVARNSGG